LVRNSNLNEIGVLVGVLEGYWLPEAYKFSIVNREATATGWALQATTSWTESERKYGWKSRRMAWIQWIMKGFEWAWLELDGWNFVVIFMHWMCNVGNWISNARH
jgi:hypothetical protein